jgi:hypothetical protein
MVFFKFTTKIGCIFLILFLRQRLHQHVFYSGLFLLILNLVGESLVLLPNQLFDSFHLFFEFYLGIGQFSILVVLNIYDLIEGVNLIFIIFLKFSDFS